MDFKSYFNKESKVLSEAYSPEYENKMVQIFNKAIRDELEAAINYKIMAEQIFGSDVSLIKKDLEEHGKEEFSHFNEFIAYAADHSILNKLKFEIRTALVNPQELPKDVQGIIQFSQDLETNAMNDYKAAAELACSVKDRETRMFFEELMKDEQKHFDSISDLDGSNRARKINEVKDV